MMSCRKLMFVSVVAYASCLTALLVGASTAAEPMRGTSTDDWRGYTVMKSGKGYASTPMGQVHYRDIGPRADKNPIVLMHQSPMSMIQFAEVQNAFADAGIRAITLDTPGYGMSDLPSKQPTIREYADNIVHVLNHLKLRKVVIAGHHTGAQIAASFAANHPDRVTSLVMHGAALFTQEEADGYISRSESSLGRTPLDDGTHLSRRFRPQTPPERQEILDAQTWTTITSFIQGPDIGHYAAFRYDMLPDLKRIKVPGLVLSDLKDPVNIMDLRVISQRPDFDYVEFSNGDLLEFMADPKRWAMIVANFMATKGKQKRIGLYR